MMQGISMDNVVSHMNDKYFEINCHQSLNLTNNRFQIEHFCNNKCVMFIVYVVKFISNLYVMCQSHTDKTYFYPGTVANFKHVKL